eukprot:scaffold98426_cov70-Attheya_sp.AAC.6
MYYTLHKLHVHSTSKANPKKRKAQLHTNEVVVFPFHDALIAHLLQPCLSNAKNADETKPYIMPFKDPQSCCSLSTLSSYEILHVFKHGNLLETRLDEAEVQELMDSHAVLNVEEEKPI